LKVYIINDEMLLLNSLNSVLVQNKMEKKKKDFAKAPIFLLLSRILLYRSINDKYRSLRYSQRSRRTFVIIFYL